MSLLVLVFWIATILLALCALCGSFYNGPNAPYLTKGYYVLVVVDLIILGLRVFGSSA